MKLPCLNSAAPSLATVGQVGLCSCRTHRLSDKSPLGRGPRPGESDGPLHGILSFALASLFWSGPSLRGRRSTRPWICRWKASRYEESSRKLLFTLWAKPFSSSAFIRIYVQGLLSCRQGAAVFPSHCAYSSFSLQKGAGERGSEEKGAGGRGSGELESGGAEGGSWRGAAESWACSAAAVTAIYGVLTLVLSTLFTLFSFLLKTTVRDGYYPFQRQRSRN